MKFSIQDRWTTIGDYYPKIFNTACRNEKHDDVSITTDRKVQLLYLCRRSLEIITTCEENIGPE